MIEYRVMTSDDYDMYWEFAPQPYEVPLALLCVPLDECVKAEIGPVPTERIALLRQLRYDQAPVPTSNGQPPWRLVSVEHLEELARRREPLTDDDRHYLPNDLLRTSPTLSIEALF